MATSDETLHEMARQAWAVRNNAVVFGETRVGCTVLSEDGTIHAGCNVEHRFRSHDVHAEVNAITSLVAHGKRAITAVVIVAERNRFTPCGACMDWIMQFGSHDTVVAFQNSLGREFQIYHAGELMPFYPH